MPTTSEGRLNLEDRTERLSPNARMIDCEAIELSRWGGKPHCVANSNTGDGLTTNHVVDSRLAEVEEDGKL
jgi:hypothetical protein